MKERKGERKQGHYCGHQICLDVHCKTASLQKSSHIIIHSKTGAPWLLAAFAEVQKRASDDVFTLIILAPPAIRRSAWAAWLSRVQEKARNIHHSYRRYHRTRSPLGF